MLAKVKEPGAGGEGTESTGAGGSLWQVPGTSQSSMAALQDRVEEEGRAKLQVADAFLRGLTRKGRKGRCETGSALAPLL